MPLPVLPVAMGRYFAIISSKKIISKMACICIVQEHTCTFRNTIIIITSGSIASGACSTIASSISYSTISTLTTCEAIRAYTANVTSCSCNVNFFYTIFFSIISYKYIFVNLLKFIICSLFMSYGHVRYKINNNY